MKSPYIVLPRRNATGIKRRTGPKFALLWEERGLFLTNRVSEKMRKGKIDKSWVASFRENDPVLLNQDIAMVEWRAYEFVRRLHIPDLPPVIPVHHRWREADMFENANAEFGLYDYITMVRGTTVGSALRTLPEGFALRYGIKRKGKSIHVMAALESQHVHNCGVYSFFENEDDVFLTKIALGPQVERYYDFINDVADYEAFSQA